MVILSLIVKRTRVKALVKDKRAALEAFGTYVEVRVNPFVPYMFQSTGLTYYSNCCWCLLVKSLVGDANSKIFLRKALRGVRAIICPNVSTF